jgi:hypothetical protein
MYEKFTANNILNVQKLEAFPRARTREEHRLSYSP